MDERDDRDRVAGPGPVRRNLQGALPSSDRHRAVIGGRRNILTIGLIFLIFLIFLKSISAAFEAKRAVPLKEDLADPKGPEEYYPCRSGANRGGGRVTTQDEEIRRRLRLGEDSRWEFKQIEFGGDTPTSPHRDHLADELGAFANADGGAMLCGVADDGPAYCFAPIRHGNGFRRQPSRQLTIVDPITPPVTWMRRKLQVRARYRLRTRCSSLFAMCVSPRARRQNGKMLRSTGGLRCSKRW